MKTIAELQAIIDTLGVFKFEALGCFKAFSNICIKTINMPITVILVDSGKPSGRKYLANMTITM